MVTVPYRHSKQCIFITADIEKAELIDQMLTIDEGFWITLISKFGSRVDQVIVANDGILKC